MKLYKIASWLEKFETAETKKLTHLKWVPTPNKHDGLGFRRIVAQKNRCELFCAWNLILQVASKGRKDTERGQLIRDGRPLSDEDLAMMTGFPVKIFTDALEFFSSPQMGWLVVEYQQPPASAGSPPEVPAESPAEGNGREGIEGNRITPFGGEMGLEFPQNLRTEAFRETWGEWVVYRKSRASCKDWVRMFQKQLDWLGSFPEATARAMLDQSIRNNWQSIQEVKNATHNNQFSPRNGGSPADKRNAVISGADRIKSELEAQGDCDDLPFLPG